MASIGGQSRWFLVVVLLVAAGPRVASSQALPPLEEHRVRTFGVEHGLPVAEVRQIEQPADGRLYLGTARGLYRYDGRSFQRVPLPRFESAIVDVLFTDSSGRLWLLTGGLEVGYLEDGRVVRLGDLHAIGAGGIDPEGARNGTTRRLFTERPDGTLWLAGRRAPLVGIDPESSHPLRRYGVADGLPSDSVVAAWVGPLGEEAVATVHRLAKVTEPGTGLDRIRFEPVGPRYDWIGWASVLKESGSLWVVHRDAMVRYDGRAVRTYDLSRIGAESWLDSLEWEAGVRTDLPGHFPLGAASDSPHAPALMAREGALWLVRVRGDTVELAYRRPDGSRGTIELPASSRTSPVYDLHEDHEGSLWVATGMGLLQLVRLPAAALSRRLDLEGGFVTAVLQDRTGTVWAGTWGRGLLRFDDGRLESWWDGDPLPDGRIRALYEAEDGTMWIGIYGRIVGVRNGRVVAVQPVESDVRDFVGDGEGGLWAATKTGLLRRTADGWRPHAPAALGAPNLWAVHRLRHGTLWLGSEGGVLRVDGDSVRSFGEPDGLRGTFIVGIHELSDGSLWFSTYEQGIHRYRNGRFTPVTTAEGLHHDGVWTMVEDGEGGVWMSSDRGVFRVDLTRLHAMADAVERGDAPREPLGPLVLGTEDGLPNLEFNRASPAAWRLEDGRILFNNMDGLVVVDPRRATKPRPAPRTVTDSLVVDGRALAVAALDGAGEPVRVDAAPRHLDFHFHALAFAFPDRVRFRYRLDGLDDTWIDAGERRSATFTSLAPGRYTFRVQSSTDGRTWPTSAASLGIVVPPLFWQATWFRVLAVLGVCIALFTVHRYRLARALEVQRLRLRIASDLHDDVGSNLSSIALLSEMLQDRQRLDALERKQLDRIRAAAEETVDSLRDVIWVIDPKHDELPDLVGRMRRVAGEMMNGVSYDFVVGSVIPARKLPMPFIRNVYLIFKEALHNVLRHAGAERVRIEVSVEDDLLHLRVLDDGRGFDPERSNHGYGLANMRRRAAEVDGQLSIRHGEDGGTEVELRARMA